MHPNLKNYYKIIIGSFVCPAPGVVFTKAFTIILRSFSWLRCCSYKRQTKKVVFTLVIMHPCPNYDRKKFVSGFVNMTQGLDNN